MEGIIYDLIVVGGEPAGLTATIYAIHKLLNVLMVSKDLGGKPIFTYRFLGLKDYQVMYGLKIVDRFWRELEYLDFARQMKPVEAIKKAKGNFSVHTKGGHELVARTVIVASGTQNND